MNQFGIAYSNQLNYIHDKAESWIGGYYDIHDEPTNNYGYDQIGNIIKDSIENITAVNWNVYGKITGINHSTTQWYNDALNISYTYDAAGNRISKRITTSGTSTVNYTWYVRDASGNMMATYTGSVDSSTSGVDSLQSSNLSLDNYYLYGSSRIGQFASHFGVTGMDSTTADYYSPWNDLTSYWFRGEKQYELDNHLGNVLVTVSDDKIGVPKASNSSLIDHYTPVVINAQDYYPFGMLMQGRIVTSFYNYYFGFNGKEKDDEAKGVGNQIDYGARVYDPRLGRFLSVDPLTNRFSMLSPYQYASDRPVDGLDFDGQEWKSSTVYDNFLFHVKFVTNNVHIKVINDSKVAKNTDRLLNLVATRFNSTFKKYDETNKTVYNANLSFEFVKGKDVNKNKDFYIDLNDKKGDPLTNSIGNTQVNGISFPVSIRDKNGKLVDLTSEEDYFLGLLSRRILHELGHTLGLFHLEDDFEEKKSANPVNPLKTSMSKAFVEGKLNYNLMIPQALARQYGVKNPGRATELTNEQLKYATERINKQQDNPDAAHGLNPFTGEEDIKESNYKNN